MANLADRLGKSQSETRQIIDAYLDDLLEHLHVYGHVTIPGFGILRTVTRPARRGFDPFNGERIEIPESLRITFQAAKKTKNRLGLGPRGPIVRQAVQPVDPPKSRKTTRVRGVAKSVNKVLSSVKN